MVQPLPVAGGGRLQGGAGGGGGGGAAGRWRGGGAPRPGSKCKCAYRYSETQLNGLELSGPASPISIRNRALMATAGWILVFSQFKQVMVLPMSFFDYGSLGIGGYAGPMDGLQGIVRSTHRMSGDMCSCHRLTCGTGSRASGTILSYVTSSGMRGKRSRADDSHPKLPCIQPRPKCFDRVSRALVLWILLLKVRHDTLNTINSPRSEER